MDDRERRQVDTISNGGDVLEELIAGYPALKEIAAHGKTIRMARAKIRALAGTQSANSGKLPASAAVTAGARKKLRARLLIPTARRARKYFSTDPTVLGAMRVPHAHASLAIHADAALAMANALAPHRKAWRDAGLPSDIVGDLKAAANAIRVTAKRHENAQQTSTSAGRQIDVLIRDARDDIRLVDALLAAEMVERADDRKFNGLVVRWHVATRVGRRKGRPPTRGRRKPRPSDPAD